MCVFVIVGGGVGFGATNSLSRVELQECNRKPKAPWWLCCFHDRFFEQREQGTKDREREGGWSPAGGYICWETLPPYFIRSDSSKSGYTIFMNPAVSSRVLSHTLTRCTRRSERQKAPVLAGPPTDTVWLLHRRQLSLNISWVTLCLNGSLSSGTYFHLRRKRNTLKGKTTWIPQIHIQILSFAYHFLKSSAN